MFYNKPDTFLDNFINKHIATKEELEKMLKDNNNFIFRYIKTSIGLIVLVTTIDVVAFLTSPIILSTPALILTGFHINDLKDRFSNTKGLINDSKTIKKNIKKN